jgi:hypothetical protein
VIEWKYEWRFEMGVSVRVEESSNRVRRSRSGSRSSRRRRVIDQPEHNVSIVVV